MNTQLNTCQFCNKIGIRLTKVLIYYNRFTATRFAFDAFMCDNCFTQLEKYAEENKSEIIKYSEGFVSIYFCPQYAFEDKESVIETIKLRPKHDDTYMPILP